MEAINLIVWGASEALVETTARKYALQVTRTFDIPAAERNLFNWKDCTVEDLERFSKAFHEGGRLVDAVIVCDDSDHPLLSAVSYYFDQASVFTLHVSSDDERTDDQLQRILNSLRPKRVINNRSINAL